MKRVLIAGGAGFIGSNLCDLLVQKGYHVVCCDNLLTGKKSNIIHLIKNPYFEFHKIDISKGPFPKKKFDFVFHLASPASPVDYQKFPEETALVNSIGTRNLLQLAQKNKARFVFASTSEIYGDPLEHPQREIYWGNVNSFGPRSCYDEAKRFGEALCFIYLTRFNLDIRIARIFNTYGPRMQKNDGRVVSNFINQSISGKPITIYGDGRQTRSFCFVSDLTNGLEKLMFTTKIKGEVINLGNPQEYTIFDFAKKIKKITNSSSEIIFKELPTDDPRQRKPDITKARKLLNWKPEISVDEGLLRAVEYYKNL